MPGEFLKGLKMSNADPRIHVLPLIHASSSWLWNSRVKSTVSTQFLTSVPPLIYILRNSLRFVFLLCLSVSFCMQIYTKENRHPDVHTYIIFYFFSQITWLLNLYLSHSHIATSSNLCKISKHEQQQHNFYSLFLSKVSWHR